MSWDARPGDRLIVNPEYVGKYGVCGSMVKKHVDASGFHLALLQTGAELKWVPFREVSGMQVLFKAKAITGDLVEVHCDPIRAINDSGIPVGTHTGIVVGVHHSTQMSIYDDKGHYYDVLLPTGQRVTFWPCDVRLA